MSVMKPLEAHRRDSIPGEDAVVRAAVAIQDSLARLAPGTGEDSAAHVRTWRKCRRGLPIKMTELTVRNLKDAGQ